MFRCCPQGILLPLPFMENSSHGVVYLSRKRFGGLDSLMRLLLGVDVLQPLVVDALLEWMPDYMSDGGGPMG